MTPIFWFLYGFGLVIAISVGRQLGSWLFALVILWQEQRFVKRMFDFACDVWDRIIYRFGPTDIVTSTVDDFEGRAYVEWRDLRTTCVWHVPTQKHLYVRTKDLQKVKLR